MSSGPLLLRATALGELRVLQSLVRSGVDVNSRTATGSTPLHVRLAPRAARPRCRHLPRPARLQIATAKRASAVAAFLLEAGADAGAAEDAEVGGQTALHIAAEVDDPEVRAPRAMQPAAADIRRNS